MTVENTLNVLNGLENEGLIKRYVIGGGIAFLFYAEPIYLENILKRHSLQEKWGKFRRLYREE